MVTTKSKWQQQKNIIYHPLKDILLHNHAIWTKNARATYQRAATALFHDMIHKELDVFSDSALIINQVEGKWKTQDPFLQLYHARLASLAQGFDDITFHYLPRDRNRFANTLATLASLVKIPSDITVQPFVVGKMVTPAYCFSINTDKGKDAEPWYLDVWNFSQKMAETGRDWPDKLPLALWGPVRTPTRATPYSLAYDMEAVLPIEIEIPSLRMMMETDIAEIDWLKQRHDELASLVEIPSDIAEIDWLKRYYA